MNSEDQKVFVERIIEARLNKTNGSAFKNYLTSLL